MTRRPPVPLPSTAPVLRRRAGGRDPLALAVVAASAYLEARAGCRDVAQLDDLVDRRTQRLLAAMVRRRRRSRTPPTAVTLRRIVADRSWPGRIDVVVVLDTGDRIVPVSVQVRDRDGTWTITTLATPDDHRPRPPDPGARPAWEEPASVEPW